MIIVLFVATFVIALVVASLVVLAFRKPIDGILQRVVPPDLSYAWARYLNFALYVVGIAGGVRVWALDKYLTPQEPYRDVVQLTPYRWALEVYETIIGTLQGAAIVLLVFFVFALLAVVIVRVFETQAAKKADEK